MRNFTQAFQDHLDTGSTTLCFCWIVTRTDGVIYAFTDLDRDMTFLGLDFEPATGFTASATQDNLNLEVSNMQVDGYLNSDSITEQDVADGKWGGAKIDTFWVNYEDNSIFHFMNTATIANITRSGASFVFEMVGLSQQLQQSVGRVYQRRCPLILGSAKCGVDLTSGANKGSGAITIVDGTTLTASGLGAFADGDFTNGVLHFTTASVRNGRKLTVKSHQQAGSVSTFKVWEVLNTSPEVGDTFEITRGCDKTIATCNSKFANRLNFRGFNLTPGNDAIATYPDQGSSYNNGTSLLS